VRFAFFTARSGSRRSFTVREPSSTAADASVITSVP
jgi:hypothetical protein